MQRILLLAILFFPYCFCSGQFNLEISEVYGGSSLEEAMDIAVNQDSTALFFGARTFSNDGAVPGNNGGSDYWIMKRGLDGTLIWNRNYGGFNNDDLSVVMPHPDGGVLAFGTTRNEQAEFGDLKGFAGGWLIRTNAMGNLIRGKIFGDAVSEIGIDAIRHPNGNVTMAIEASSDMLDNKPNNGVFDVWIVHVDINFNIAWSALMGGLTQDSPAAITTDAQGNVYVAATSQSNLPGLPANFGGKDIWVFKLDPFGELLWQKNFGGSADDIANDILIDKAGNLFLIGHSESEDGDFISNRGFNDLWLIKLDQSNGDPVFFKSYGGEGNDVNGNLAKLGTDHLIISATTNSDSFDLSGNKGSNDVWVFMVDNNGIIKQEMNYGGSQNDIAGDLVIVDSVFYLFNSTLSSDKNVPPNTTTQQDAWFMALNSNPEPCSFQFLCPQDSTLSNELFPPATGVLTCVTGCTAGLQTGPDFIQGSCPDFIYSTAYFKLTTDPAADLVTLSVSSDEFNKPHVALLRTNNCSTFTQIACGQGANGYLLIPFIDVDPMTTYIIAISDADGNLGAFELCATSIDVEFCNERDSLYVKSASLGSPLSGPFKPGELVQICYELLDWNKLECNGFQGLIPTFGPGWDPDGFDFFGMPKQIDVMLAPHTTGFWDWYKVGDVHYNITNPIAGYGGGQGMAPGWYFTNTGDVPPNDGPDQTTGDINTCLPTPDKWKVCFTLPIEDECEEHMDASVTMRSFSDGELGVNVSLACAYDQEETLSIGMVCCHNPTVIPIQELTVCSGDTTILIPNSNLIPPFSYSWTAIAEPGIVGASSVTGANQFYQILRNETDEVLKVVYTLRAEGINCVSNTIQFTINVRPLPTSRISISGPTTVCTGSTVQLNFENTGTPPFAITLTRDNQFFANILSETPNLTIDIDPEFSGRFRVGSMYDAFCDGAGLGFVNVTVKPFGSNLIDTAICQGESIILGIDTFSQAGVYLTTLENAAENGCDSVISLTLNLIPSHTQSVNEEICNGDTLFVLGQPYTETTHQIIEFIGPFGCTDFIDLNLVVTDTFVEEFDQIICAGDTLNFEGIAVFQTGTYSHVEEPEPGCFDQTILNLTVLPQIVINDLSIIGDNGNNNGAVLVEITGGSPPFTFLWNNGATTGSLTNVMHGLYTLVVTDRHGCTEDFTFAVPFVNSVEDVSIPTLKIWPTIFSTTQNLYIHANSEINIAGVSWFDVNGRPLSGSKLEFNQVALYSVSVPADLLSGMYFINLVLDDGRASWHKVVRE